MKNLFKLSALILAIAAVVIGCRKEDKNAIVGTWVPENISIEITFNNTVDPITQGIFNVFLNEMLSSYDVEYPTFQFHKDGKAIMTEGTIVFEGTYTVKNNILSVITERRTTSGPYTISNNKLEWTIEEGVSGIIDELEDILSLLNPEDLGPFGDMIFAAIKGITKITGKVTFARQ